MNRSQIGLTIILFFVGPTFLMAQQSDSIARQPGQITFITPLGTNGRASGRTINNFSLNVLWGSSAGVTGAEFGGILNQTKGTASGLQVAGLGNINLGKIRGGHYAGLFNISKATFQGFQLAGLTNINIPSSGYSHGLQMSGLLNKNTNPVRGFQLAGILNLQTDSFEGVQMVGIASVSQQIRGVQIAGILNKTKVLSGVQIGLVNIAGSIENGAQIGLINIAKNGYHTFEVEYNESFSLNLSYKMGTDHLYSITALSYEEQKGKKLWAVGFGFGTYHQIGINTGLNIDAINYWVNEDEWWTDKLNMLDKLKVGISYHLTPQVSVFGGGSLNIHLSKIKDAEGKSKGSLLSTPDPFFDEVHHNAHIMIYPGFHAGIRF